ncbi:protoporphyrinogen oxidase [Alteribacillus bidgolensis]|uniref:Coproporphyrinogen III oxidase n=1 Tax=Alteribacillus bidgolensis TaxID=930129 RepID=A0A1G8N584_9BACI|nr:protoporphyrinogen oxidase [Alteribacillus bidgolensis]SDI75364.1 oxygen-dependent protoporphyrinogen oxidase [Alteribacillus bidgolensis]
MKVAIIGGGITGLTAAYYLQKETMSQNINMDYHLYESSSQLGGKIQTDYHNGFIIEQGPDSFLARKESAAKLAKEVGLEHELIFNNAGKAYVLKGQTLHPIPGGAIMGIPTKLGPFLTTSLFSPAGKTRAALDLFLPKSSTNNDQSLGGFFRRRLGSEVVDNLIEPLLSGIYAGDIDRLSLQSTFPQFHQVEQKHRSLILGMKASRPLEKSQEKKTGAFQTLRNGLQSLVDGLENHLDEDAINKNKTLEQIVPEQSQYKLLFTDGDSKIFDRVILATPPHVNAKLFNDKETQHLFSSITSTSVATVAMAFEEEQIPEDFNGTGFVVSKKSDYTITACTWTHLKWEHTAPKGKALLRCYVGKPGGESIVEEDDESIIEVVLKDLNKVMNVNGRPEYYKITRWRNSMPQYEVDHAIQMDKIKNTIQASYPGVFVAGAAYEGVGLPDCINQGEDVIHQLLTSLNEK